MDKFEGTGNQIGFGTDDMVVCKSCKRKGPPNRTNCLYCGNQFDPADFRIGTVRLKPDKPENWQTGFNLVITGTQQKMHSADLETIARIFALDVELVDKLFEAKEALPIARLSSIEDANAALQKLSQVSIGGTIVSDEVFGLKVHAKRLREISFENDRIGLKLFNTGELLEFPKDDLILIVSGSIYEKKIETIERHSKSKENKPLSIDETAKDEKVFDIYNRADPIGFRVFAHGFDFSCLGNEMSILASDNMEKLLLKLKRINMNVTANESYDRIRSLIGGVWEIEAADKSRSVESKGVGKFNINKTTKYSNLNQFTRYSRLKRHLL